MKSIILISCCKQKAKERCKAKNMYISPLFKLSWKYAKQFDSDIYILSAKYGLLNPETIIEPYDLTLKKFSKDEQIKWSSDIVEKLKNICSLENDKFIILAGNTYIEYILPFIKNYELPMIGLGLGKRLKWLNKHTDSEYLLL